MSAGTVDETVVSITDDDVPAVKVSYDSATYTVAEGGTVTVTVRLDADPERTVTIPIIATGQEGADADDDYSGVPQDVTFTSGGSLTATFTFSATADDVDDDGESVKLTFGSTLPDDVSAGTVDETVVSITDDDVPAINVSFGSATYSVQESDDTTTTDITENEVTVTVTLSADPERSVTIPITATGQDGAADADYSGVPTSVTFVSEDTEETFTFTATHDTVDDDGESVKLTFGTTLPDDVSAGTVDETVVSITDDDVPAVKVSYDSATYTVAEGGTVTVTVRLDADPERSVTHPHHRDGPGRGGCGRRLLGRAAGRDLHQRREPHGDVHVQRHGRRCGRRRGVGEADLRDDAARRRERGDRRRDGGLDHGRRRAGGEGELRLGHLYGRRGRHGHGYGEAGRGPGAGA